MKEKKKHTLDKGSGIVLAIVAALTLAIAAGCVISLFSYYSSAAKSKEKFLLNKKRLCTVACLRLGDTVAIIKRKSSFKK